MKEECSVGKKSRMEENNQTSFPGDVKSTETQKRGKIATTTQVIRITFGCCYVLEIATITCLLKNTQFKVLPIPI